MRGEEGEGFLSFDDPLPTLYTPACFGKEAQMDWTVTILVSRKPGIHHPEAAQILAAITGSIGLEIKVVTGLRMNKHFVLTVSGPATREEVETIAARIGTELFANFALEDAKIVGIAELRTKTGKTAKRGLRPQTGEEIRVALLD